MIIDTAIVPVAGLGTRMLPATKEQPKEMLPVPVRDPKYGLVFKPLLQLVFELLYDIGIRNFIFVVGRGKRSIEDYFTPDWGFAHYLEARGKKREAKILSNFYRKVENSIITWVNQPEPRGFGDAVYRGSLLVGDKPFIVHAGDIVLFNTKSMTSYSLKKLIRTYVERRPKALILVRKVSYPQHYGVVIPKEKDTSPDVVYIVKKVIEKPKEPISNLAIMAVYIFDQKIRDALGTLELRELGEVELTEAIQRLIDWSFRVEALEADDNDYFIDIGRPESYLDAIQKLIGFNFNRT